MRRCSSSSIGRRRAHSLLPDLSPGTVVTLKDPAYLKDRPRPSHMPKYDGKRYIVVRKTQSGTYVLRDMQGDLLDRHVPIDQMKLVRGWRESDSHKGDVFEVEKVLDHHLHDANQTMYYLIKWKGFPKATWEPSYNLIDNHIIANYNKYRSQHPQARPSPYLIPFKIPPP